MFRKLLLFFVALALPLTLAACGGSSDTEFESVSVDPSSVSLEVGETVSVEVTVLPADIEFDVAWASEDESIATVDNGDITGVAAGTTNIIVTVEGEDAVVEVTVTDETDEVDTIAPILTVDPSDVTIEYGQDYDLMNGVTALDNVDGNITSEIEIVSDGGFDNMTPGEYTVEYRVEDSSGNEATATRTITVNELRTTVTIALEDGEDEETYPLAYNPELYYRDSVNSLVFPRGFVTALDADYYNWLVENQPNRILTRWSVVVVLDGDGDVYLSRDYLSNQTNQDGTTGPAANYDWCSGSASGGNDEWCTHLGMVANIDVPEGGHVLIFPNGAGPNPEDGNGEDSPRFFGAHYFANSEFGPEDRISMNVTLNNVIPELAFDESQARPTLDISGILVNLEVGDTFPDLLDGVSATDDMTVEVTRVWYYDEDNAEVVVDVNDINTDAVRNYYVRYRVEDSEGRYDQGHRVYQIQEPVDEDAENIGTINLGFESYTAIFNFSNFADEYNVHENQAYVLTKDFLLEQIAAFEENGDEFQIRFSVLAVTDAYGNILHYRHLLAREISDEFPFPGGDGGWPNNAQLDQDLLDAIPEDGFLVVFPNDDNIGEGGARHTGVSWLYHEDGLHSEEPTINPLEQRLTFSFEDFEMAEKTGTVTIEGESYDAIHNLSRFYDFSNVRVNYDVVHLLDKDYLEQQLDLFAAANDGEIITVAFSFLVVLDENGQPLVIRNVLGEEVRHDDQTVNESPGWANNNQLAGILDEIPEGGQLAIFVNGFDVREWGGEMLWNEGPVFNADGDETQTWRGDFTVDAFNRTVSFEATPKFLQESGSFEVDGESYDATRNLSVFFTEDNIGTNYPVVHVLDRDYLEYGLDLYAAANDGDTKIVQFSFVMVVDENGAPLVLRNVLGQEVRHDDQTMNTEPGWSNGNMLAGILDEVPEGGQVLIFHGGGDVRDIAGYHFWSDQNHDGDNPDQTWRNPYEVDAFSKTVTFVSETEITE